MGNMNREDKEILPQRLFPAMPRLITLDVPADERATVQAVPPEIVAELVQQAIKRHRWGISALQQSKVVRVPAPGDLQAAGAAGDAENADGWDEDAEDESAEDQGSTLPSSAGNADGQAGPSPRTLQQLQKSKLRAAGHSALSGEGEPLRIGTAAARRRNRAAAMDAPLGAAGSRSHLSLGGPGASRGTLEPGGSTRRAGRDLGTMPNDPLVKGRAALPALFRQKDAFKLLQPEGFLDPGDGAADQGEEEDLQPPVPRLRENLEVFLADKLQLVDRMAASYGNSGVASLNAANLSLDAHRQTFEAFIHSFTTYRPLLLRIKKAYDVALEDALHMTHDNVHMRAELAAQEQVQAAALDAARAEAAKAAAATRGDLYQRLLDAQARIQKAETSSTASESTIAACTVESRNLRGTTIQLQQQIRALRAELVAGSSFQGLQPP